jgi:hypothetical protein
MKNYIFIFIIALFNTINVFTEQAPLDPCYDCKNKFEPNYPQTYYPYIFCDPNNHKLVKICTNGDPYNLPSPFTGFQPMKLCLPLEYESDVTYSNDNEPWSDLGPWIEQIFLGQYENDFEFHDEDIPDIIQAALDYWQNICSPYNNDGCQSCSIKIRWAKDEKDMGSDYLLPSHVNNPLIQDECNYDCSKLAIILNGTSGFCSQDATGKPNHYFFTRGGSTEPGYGSYLVNADLRTEIIHQLGVLLGFGNTMEGCGETSSVMVTSGTSIDQYLVYQQNRLGGLDNGSSINPEYSFIPAPGYIRGYEECLFRLLYCCEGSTSVQENDYKKLLDFNIVPNPASLIITIQFNIDAYQHNNIGIYNLLGERLISVIDNKWMEPKSYSMDIDINSLNSGVYYCVYRNNNKILTRIFVVLR